MTQDGTDKDLVATACNAAYTLIQRDGSENATDIYELLELLFMILGKEQIERDDITEGLVEEWFDSLKEIIKPYIR